MAKNIVFLLLSTPVSWTLVRLFRFCFVCVSHSGDSASRTRAPSGVEEELHPLKFKIAI